MALSEGNVYVTDGAIPAVKNGYWLVVLPSTTLPTPLNRLPIGTYIGLNGRWVSQPNTTFNITINQGGLASVTIKRTDNSTIATATTPEYTVADTTIVNTNGEEIAVALAAGADVVIPLQQAEGTTGLGGITFPANTTGTIPNVNYTDSDGSEQSEPYGAEIVCTPQETLDEQVATASDSEIVTAINNAGKGIAIRDDLIQDQIGGSGILMGLEFGTSLSTPRGLDVYSGTLYVANVASNNLLLFNIANKSAAPTVYTGLPTGFSKVAVDGTYILGVGSTNTTNSIQVRSFASPATTVQTISYGARTYSCALIGGVAYVGALLVGEYKKYDPATGAQIGSAISTSNSSVRAILPHTNGTQYWVLTSNGALGTVELRNLSDDSLASSFSVNGGAGLNAMAYCNGNLCITYNQATGPSFLRGYSTAGVLQYTTYLNTLNCFGVASTGTYLMFSKDAYNELSNLFFVT